MFEGYLL